MDITLSRNVRTFMAAALLVAGLLFSTTQVASANEFKHGHACERFHHMMLHGGPVGFYLLNQDALGLTKSQVGKLSDLKLSFAKTFIREKSEIRILHLENMKLLMHRRVDTAQVHKNVNAILGHKKKIKLAFVDMISNANRVLTPEQFQKSKKLFRAMILRMHAGRAQGGNAIHKA